MFPTISLSQFYMSFINILVFELDINFPLFYYNYFPSPAWGEDITIYVSQLLKKEIM